MPTKTLQITPSETRIDTVLAELGLIKNGEILDEPLYWIFYAAVESEDITVSLGFSRAEPANDFPGCSWVDEARWFGQTITLNSTETMDAEEALHVAIEEEEDC